MALTVRIEGRGPVAAALALFLLREGFSADQIDAEHPADTLPDWLGARAIALSRGSLELLAPHVPEFDPRGLRAATDGAAPIDSVAILRAGALGRTLITPEPEGPSCLGAVLRYATLHQGLRHALNRARSNRPAADNAWAGTGPGAMYGPQVRVIADGEAQGGTVRDFGQSALIAEVIVERGSPGRAWERFTDDGPLALLPLPDPAGRRRALVWCAPTETAEHRRTLSAHAFDRELIRAFGPALGRIHVDGPRFSTPVRRQYRPLRIDPLTVAIGNAAQTLHPVAGQGLNLGLRDAWVLARCLGDWQAGVGHGRGSTRARGQTQGDGIDGVLDDFCERRRVDRHTMIAITDALASLPRQSLLNPIQSIALASLELSSSLRASARSLFTHGLRTL